VDYGVESPLVGREREVAALVGAAAEASAGTPRCVVVSGEAGIGKTRLVAEAVAGLDDALVLAGHAVDMATGDIPFAVLTDTIRDLRHQRGERGLTEAERSALAPLLPGCAEPAGVQPATIMGAALDLFTRLGEDRLLVWVVEDLHWADAESRDLVELIVRGVRGRVLVVVTARTGDPRRAVPGGPARPDVPASLARVPHALRLDLPRLTNREVRVLVENLAAGLPPAVLRTMIRLADGVPFEVEELVVSHRRGDTSLFEAELTGRLSGLGADARRLVEAAAIGDGHLRLSLVEHVVGAAASQVDAALADAAGAGIVRWDNERDSIGFRHALVREAVRAQIGPGARRTWHRRWAEVLASSARLLAADPAALAIAEHWARAGDVKRSVSAAFAALPAARRMADGNRRLVLWRRILEGWESRDPVSPVGRLTLRRVIGEALKGPHRTPDERTNRRFLAAARTLPLEAPELALLEVFETLLTLPKGVDPVDEERIVRAATACDWLSEPPDELTLTALAWIGQFLPASEDRRADAFLSRAEDLAAAWGDQDRRLHVARARTWRIGGAGRWAEEVQVWEHLWPEIPPEDAENRLKIAGNLGWCLVTAGRHDAADAVMTEVLDTVAHPETMPHLWEHLVENAVATWVCIGDWDRARRLAEQSAPWWTDDLRISNLWLAQLDLLQTGRTDEHRWREHLGVAIPMGPDDTTLRWFLAHASGLRGDLPGMRELIEPVWQVGPGVLDDTTGWVAPLDVSRHEADAAVLDPHRADRAEGARHLVRMAEVLRGAVNPAPHEVATAQEVAAQVDRFHGRDARRALLATLKAWEELDHVPDVAVTRLSLAEACASAGDRDAARHHLAEGRSIAVGLAARPWVDRADAIADRYGLVRGDRSPHDLLTTREREVLTLLAQGHTNKEIARMLVMSPKTASVHVSRIIAKTGATNRTQAVAMAGEKGLLDRPS
jgi:DNA-binding CsgD family transcriptional regulator